MRCCSVVIRLGGGRRLCGCLVLKWLADGAFLACLGTARQVSAAMCRPGILLSRSQPASRDVSKHSCIYLQAGTSAAAVVLQSRSSANARHAHSLPTAVCSAVWGSWPASQGTACHPTYISGAGCIRTRRQVCEYGLVALAHRSPARPSPSPSVPLPPGGHTWAAHTCTNLGSASRQICYFSMVALGAGKAGLPACTFLAGVMASAALFLLLFSPGRGERA